MIVPLFLTSTVLALASGCIGPSADELHGAARSLAPSGSNVVEEVEGDCVELARSPSCVHIYFVPARASLDERVAAAQETARAAGWDDIRTEIFSGGAQLRFRRGRLAAVVNVWAEERAARCREAPSKDCADSAFVEPD